MSVSISGNYRCIGFKTFELSTVKGLADIGLDVGAFSLATVAVISTEDQIVRWTMDGATTPTTSLGEQQETTDVPLQIYGKANIDQFQMVSASGTTTINVHIFK